MNATIGAFSSAAGNEQSVDCEAEIPAPHIKDRDSKGISKKQTILLFENPGSGGEFSLCTHEKVWMRRNPCALTTKAYQVGMLLLFLLSSEASEMKVIFHFRTSDDNKRLIPRGLPREPEGSRACPGVLIPFYFAPAQRVSKMDLKLS